MATRARQVGRTAGALTVRAAVIAALPGGTLAGRVGAFFRLLGHKTSCRLTESVSKVHTFCAVRTGRNVKNYN